MTVFDVVVGLVLVLIAIAILIHGRNEQDRSKWVAAGLLFAGGMLVGSLRVGVTVFSLILVISLFASGAIYANLVWKPRQKQISEEREFLEHNNILGDL